MRDRQDAVAKLQGEKDRLAKQLTAVRAEMLTLRVGGDNEGMRSQQAVITFKLQEINKKLSETVSDQAMAEMAAKQIEEQMRNGEMEKNPNVIQALDMDPTYRSLIYQKGQYETQLDTVKRTHGNLHKMVLNLQTLIDSTDGQMKDRKKQIIQDQSQKEFETRQVQLSMLTRQREDLQEQLKKATDESRDLESQSARFVTKSTEATDLEKQLSMLDEKIMDRKLVLNRPRPGEDPNSGPVSIGAYATEPRERSQPQLKIMIPVGIALGLMIGFGLAFLLELTDTSIKNPGDVTRRLELPLLGMVPHVDDMEEDLKDIYKVVLESPLSPAAEAFRHIRTNLFFSGPLQSRRSLLVTSPASEDGRTTVVTNLAICIAQAGKKVLIVDSNFRQAALTRIFPSASGSQGLSSALVGAVGWRDAVVATEIPNLSVMPAGPMPPNPAELLGSEFARRMVEEMKAEYDQVIFDGSPVMIVTDARVLSTQVDGVIMVVRAGVSNLGEVHRSLDQLARVGSHVLGAVLQGVRMTAGGYLKKNYEAFYEYHQKSIT
jgi:capsular exopolysaccharide synthesis family protein